MFQDIKIIPKKFWEESYLKWQEIVRMTEAGELFINYKGFSNLQVLEECGYCKYLEIREGSSLPTPNCTKCSLFTKRMCHLKEGGRQNFPFWKYVYLMSLRNKDISAEALVFAKQILASIKEDGLEWEYIFDTEKTAA
jgi:hypothetical protein